MIFPIFAAIVLIIYGVLCFVAIDVVWRLSVPEAARSRVNRRRWDLVTRIAGAFAITIGLIILAGVIR